MTESPPEIAGIIPGVTLLFSLTGSLVPFPFTFIVGSSSSIELLFVAVSFIEGGLVEVLFVCELFSCLILC